MTVHTDVERPRPYRVSVVDRHDDDARPRWINVTAYGANDISNQVKDIDPALLILATEAVDVEEAYRKAYGDDFDKLATWQAEGR